MVSAYKSVPYVYIFFSCRLAIIARVQIWRHEPCHEWIQGIIIFIQKILVSLVKNGIVSAGVVNTEDKSNLCMY